MTVSGVRTLFPVAAVLVACTASNPVMPLRGEDPTSLKVSLERQEWLQKTGATRAFEAFRAALRKHDWEAAVERTGPATRAALARRAKELATDAAGALKAGPVPGLGLPGVDDPVHAFLADGNVTVREDASFDPARRKARLAVGLPGRDEPVQVPALFTEDGWRVELVSVLEVPAAPAAVPGSTGP
jgi:hypothetical protein